MSARICRMCETMRADELCSKKLTCK
ncbi:hypothetical protein PUN28_008293 [Cardiocondyla obscurior]|uniref:Uncharacterized protein n=1 Tax=Cardiocondyla obscurior TaxID=286306 RepID=A0AAW2FYY8_9HYME